MPSYEIYIDSRDRISGSASDAMFRLNHTLTNVRSVYCKSFVFYNIFEPWAPLDKVTFLDVFLFFCDFYVLVSTWLEFVL